MTQTKPARELGRQLAYRIVLHEVCRTGEHELHRHLLERLAKALGLEPPLCDLLLVKELAASQGRPARPFDARRAMRAALRVAATHEAVSEKEARILSRLAKCLDISPREQTELAVKLRQEMESGMPAAPSLTSPAHPAILGLDEEPPRAAVTRRMVRPPPSAPEPQERPRASTLEPAASLGPIAATIIGFVIVAVALSSTSLFQPGTSAEPGALTGPPVILASTPAGDSERTAETDPKEALARAGRTAETWRMREAAALLTPGFALAPATAGREWSLERLARLAPEQENVRRALRRIANDRTDPLRLSAVLALGRGNDTEVRHLAEKLAKSGEPAERWAGQLTLARLSSDTQGWNRVWEQEDPWIVARWLALADDADAELHLTRLAPLLEGDDLLEALGLLARSRGGMGVLGSSLAVETLMELTSHPDALARAAAVDALGQIGDESAVPIVTRALESPRPGERIAAARALAALGAPETAPMIAKLLADPDRELRERCATALLSFDDLPLEQLGDQWARAAQGSPERRLLGGVLFAPDAPWSAEALSILTGAALPSDRAQVERAKEGLSQIEGRREDLEVKMHTGNGEEQVNAGRALAGGRLADANRLAVLASSPNPFVRRRGLRLLARKNAKPSFGLLTGLLPNLQLMERPILTRALAEVNSTQLLRSLSQLYTAGAGDNPAARAQRRIAAWGLARSGEPACVGELLRASRDDVWQVRLAASWGLARLLDRGGLGPTDQELIQKRLGEMRSDPQLAVQWASAALEARP